MGDEHGVSFNELLCFSSYNLATRHLILVLSVNIDYHSILYLFSISSLRTSKVGDKPPINTDQKEIIDLRWICLADSQPPNLMKKRRKKNVHEQKSTLAAVKMSVVVFNVVLYSTHTYTPVNTLCICFFVSGTHVYTHIYRPISVPVRVFTNGSGDGVQSLVESYQRLKKWYLMSPCLTLSIIRYISRVNEAIKGK